LRTDFRSGTALVPKDRTLPGAAEWQIADSLLYTFANSALLPSVAFSHRYISTAPGALVPSPQEQGGYNLFDVRLSATIAGVGVSAFVENIGDQRGITQAVTNNRGVSEYIVRPRTYGMTFDYRF
jgi:outer membrane receptor protein involved in Fe transport